MADRTILTAARLREVLNYNPDTGEFRWIERKGGRRAKVGTVQRRKDGTVAYIRIRVDYLPYKAHRLAWFYMTGEWPSMDLDHIDRNPAYNRWLNLREATATVNNGNRNKWKWKPTRKIRRSA
jgi:hypothetical protein